MNTGLLLLCLIPEGDPVAVIGDSFNASIVGQYTVTYTVTFNGVSESKSSTFYAVDPDDSNDQGEPGGNDQGDPDDGGSSPATEYKAGVMTSIGGGASDDPFTVSGNTVSVKKASSEGDYKGVKWELSDWSNAKAPKMSIEISNNTSAALKAKFKLVTDKGDCYSHPDFELEAEESSAWVTVFSENNDFSTKGATSITAIELWLITTRHPELFPLNSLSLEVMLVEIMLVEIRVMIPEVLAAAHRPDSHRRI